MFINYYTLLNMKDKRCWCCMLEFVLGSRYFFVLMFDFMDRWIDF